MYEAWFLGGACLRLDGAPVAGPVSQRHPLGLLALLAAHPVGEVSREQLVAYLWPDRDASHARHLLSEALYVLRSTVGRDAIRNVGAGLVLDGSLLWTDVGAFQAALETRDHATAVEVYRGPFLDGFHLPDGGDFQHWADGRRMHLASQYGLALDALAAEATAAGNELEAAHWLRIRLALDPLSSSSTRRLMAGLARAGDRAEAIRVGRAYEIRLRDQMGLPPAEDVTRFRARLESPRWIAPRRAPAKWMPGRSADRRAAERTPRDPFEVLDRLPEELGPVGARDVRGPGAGAGPARWGRFLSVVLAGAVALAAVIRIFLVSGPSSAAPSVHVAVIPFSSCCDETLADEARRFATLLSDTLTALTGDTCVGPAGVLAQWKAPNPPSAVRDEALESFAARMGVTHYVTGAVLEAEPAEVHVALSLRQVSRDEAVYTRYASVATRDLQDLFESMAGALAERVLQEPRRTHLVPRLTRLFIGP